MACPSESKSWAPTRKMPRQFNSPNSWRKKSAASNHRQATANSQMRSYSAPFVPDAVEFSRRDAGQSLCDCKAIDAPAPVGPAQTTATISTQIYPAVLKFPCDEMYLRRPQRKK